MTEAEWLACTEPLEMLDFLRLAQPSERKMRLFACACCRRVAHFFTRGPELGQALEVSERYADGGVSRESLAEAAQAAARAAAEYPGGASETDFTGADQKVAVEGVAAAVRGDCHDAVFAAWYAADSRRREDIAALARDLFGNPFRPANLGAWRTPDALALATAIYREAAFERLPILADALEEAGCTDEAALRHGRQGGLHARGCWLLDALLGNV
jgi:hypothetical protein